MRRLLTPLAALLLTLARGSLPARSAEAPAVTVTVHGDRPAGRLDPESYANFSTGSIYGQLASPAAEGAMAWVRATGAVRYARCYNWLGDGIPKEHPQWFSGCRVAKSGPGGAPVYQWEALERVLDTLLASGVRPFIVCGGLPDALIEGKPRRNESGAAVNRPRDYAQYQELVAQMVRRLEKSYGAEEVRSWYFEVWDQPDHEGSFEGGRPAPFTGDAEVEPFTRLYDHFAAGAASVDARVRVGGPGIAGDMSFLRRFLEHCERGNNPVSGKSGAKLDFISWHAYGTPEQILARDAEVAALIEKEFPELKPARRILSDSGPSPSDAVRPNSAPEAARLAALVAGNAAQGERGVAMLFRSGDLVDDHYDGFRPLLTQLGTNVLPNPAFQLSMLLAKMGGERLAAEISAPGGEYGALAARPRSRTQHTTTQLLLYRRGQPGAAPAAVRVKFTGLASELFRLPMRLYRIDAEHSRTYEAWVAAGRPADAAEDLAKKWAEEDVLRPAEENPNFGFSKGEATLDVRLPVDSVVVVTLGVEPTFEPALCERAKRYRKAEDELNTAAELQHLREFERAEDACRRIAQKYAGTYWQIAALHALVGLYQLDLKSPEQAEAARRELLSLPVDDFTRLRLLERQRVDAVRKADQGEISRLGAEMKALEARLAEERQWPLQRYAGQ